MKRLMTVFAAVAFSFTLLFNCTHFFNPVVSRAEDNNIYLTPVQTRALFGDDIAADYYDSYGTLHHEFFRFYSTAVNINGLDYIIYMGDFSSVPSGSNDNKDWIIHLEPSVSLSHLYTFDMDIGFRVTGSWSLPYSRVQKNKVVVSANTDNFNVMTPYSFEMATSNQGGGYYSASIIDLTESQSHETWKMSYIRTYLYSNHSFSVSFYDPDYPADYGVFQNGMYDSFDDKCYMIIQCPFLSDTYNIDSSNSSSSSVPDSSSSVLDSPDYSGSLQDILDKLDEIAEKQGLYGQVTNEQLNDIYIENQRQNSKLDSANDKLNQVNSNLNKINSTIENLNIPDLVSQSARDSSHIADNTSRMAAEISEAMQDHQYIDSIARSAEVSLPNLDNQHALDSSFNDVWYYTDEDGLKWSNPLLFAMPIVTLTIGVLSYIIFGKKG